MTIPQLTIVSPNDHVFEPPTLWVGRLARRYRENGPRVELLPEAAPAVGPAGVSPERAINGWDSVLLVALRGSLLDDASIPRCARFRTARG